MAKSKLPSLDDADAVAVGVDVNATSISLSVDSQPAADPQPVAEVVTMHISVPSMQFPAGAYVSDDVYLKRIPTKSAEKLKRIALGLECRGETLSNGTRVRCISHAILYILERLEVTEQKI